MVAAFMQNCTAGTARKCLQGEGVWKSREIRPWWQHTWPRGAMRNSASGSAVKYDGEKNPSPCYCLRNRWNQGEPGHLKTMERFFLGFMFGQGETLRLWFSRTRRTEVLSRQLPSQGTLPFPCSWSTLAGGTPTAPVPTQDDEFRLGDLRMSWRQLVQTQIQRRSEISTVCWWLHSSCLVFFRPNIW